MNNHQREQLISAVVEAAGKDFALIPDIITVLQHRLKEETRVETMLRCDAETALIAAVDDHPSKNGLLEKYLENAKGKRFFDWRAD